MEAEMRIHSGAGWETIGQEGEQAEGYAAGTAGWDKTGTEVKPGSVHIGARKSKEKQEMWRPDKVQKSLQDNRLLTGFLNIAVVQRISLAFLESLHM